MLGRTSREKILKTRTDCDLNKYRCLNCKTDFSSIKTLHCHMLSKHSENRLYYLCPLCETTFVQSWSVRRHLLKVHKLSKEETVSLKINTKSTLESSMSQQKSQTERAAISKLADFQGLKCLRCSRDFSTPANLRKHVAGHLGLKRFWCRLCNYKSFNRSECQNHVKRIHSAHSPEKYIEHKGQFIHEITKM
ncbi:hypothetical protein JTE90_028853 [Oedothorax gibbosus]|uniref:C2H2-type domain-containing protein n=1 Tax=Oedothorax gibbosus TaxID=931172 RepID=A0AAV6VYK2_9ARAC|nr:hypothetical protein JTE90_028853 [Oedothorax gibbosus]